MSHNNFSILALPMIFSKNVFSIRGAFPTRKLARSINKRPNRVVLLGELDSIWFLNIVRAWSCKFSTCVVSFNPVVSEKVNKNAYFLYIFLKTMKLKREKTHFHKRMHCLPQRQRFLKFFVVEGSRRRLGVKKKFQKTLILVFEV